MTRHRPSGGYGHHIQKLGHDHYRLSWCWDRYYEGSRLRFPQAFYRDTDEKGARRFAKRWNVEVPT